MAQARLNERNMGHPVQIIDIEMHSEKPSRMTIQHTNLRAILNSVGNRNVALISIAGPSRYGKSFFLSFMIGYLRCLENEESADWLKKEDRNKALVGFPFQNGIERVTTGIWLWSRPFIIKNVQGEEIAVLLMDTQGVFDSHTTMKEWSAIVGISLLTSSCLIYNIGNNLQEDALSILENFLQFGSMAMDQSESGESCFQKLVFLIRDWNMPDDCEYGPLGGQRFLQHRLQIGPHLPPTSVRVRQTLKKCFEEIDCFLMPDPGEEAKSNDFKGSLAELDDKFIGSMVTFMELLLNPEQISRSVKRVNGQVVKAKDLATYFTRYATLFNTGEMPSPTNIMDATAYASFELLVSKSLEVARNQLMEFVEQKSFVADQDELNEKYNLLRNEAMATYDAKRKFGDPKIAEQHRVKLEAGLKKLLGEAKGKNDELKHEITKLEISKLVEKFKEHVSQHLASGAILRENLEEILSKEAELTRETFYRIFESQNNFAEENAPVLTEKISRAAETFRTDNGENIRKSKELVSSAVEKALRLYQENTNLILEGDTEEDIFSNTLLQKLDSIFRKQAYASLPIDEETSEELLKSLRAELDAKLNKEFAKFFSLIEIKYVDQQFKMEEFIDEMTKQYFSEMTEAISEEPDPDEVFLVLKHVEIQLKVSNLFIEQSVIRDVRNILPYKNALDMKLQESFESAKNSLEDKHENTMQKMLSDIEIMANDHRTNISVLINMKPICSVQDLQETHEDILRTSLAKLILPKIFSYEEKRGLTEMLDSNLKQDFNFLLETYNKKVLEDNSIAESETEMILRKYQRKLNNQLDDLVEKSQLDLLYTRNRDAATKDLKLKLKFVAPEIMSQYQIKLDGQLDKVYESISKSFELRLTGMNQLLEDAYQDSISQYCNQMEEKMEQNLEKDALKQWHELYAEKVLMAFDRNTKTVNINSNPKRTLLGRQLLKEFQRLREIAKQEEEEIIESKTKLLDDALEIFKQRAESILLDQFIGEEAFENKLAQCETTAEESFYSIFPLISRKTANNENYIKYSGKIKAISEQLRSALKENVSKVNVMAKTAVDMAVEKYRENMELRCAQTEGEVFSDDFMLKLDSIYRWESFSLFKTSVNDAPQEFLEPFSTNLNRKITQIYSRFATENATKRSTQQHHIQRFIEEIKDAYLFEMTAALSSESTPTTSDATYQEQKHYELLYKYSDDFLRRCKIQDVGTLLRYKDALNVKLQESLLLAKKRAAQKRDDTKQKSFNHFLLPDLGTSLTGVDRPSASCNNGLRPRESVSAQQNYFPIDESLRLRSVNQKSFSLVSQSNSQPRDAIGQAAADLYSHSLKKIPGSYKTECGIGIRMELEVSCVTVSTYKDGKVNCLTKCNDPVIGFNNGEVIIKSSSEIGLLSPIVFSKLFNGNVEERFRVKWNSRLYSFGVEECIAIFLSKWRTVFQVELGCLINACVIAVPSFLSQVEVRAIHDAGAIAGFEKVKVLRDNSAAVVGLSIWNKGEAIASRFVLVNIDYDIWHTEYYDLEKGMQGTTVLNNSDFLFRTRLLPKALGRIVQQYANGKVVDLVVLATKKKGFEIPFMGMQSAQEEGINKVHVKNSVIEEGCALLAALLIGDADAKRHWQRFYPNSSSRAIKYNSIEEFWNTTERTSNTFFQNSKRIISGQNLPLTELVAAQQNIRPFVVGREQAVEEANRVLLDISKKVQMSNPRLGNAADGNYIMKRIDAAFAVLRTCNDVAEIDDTVISLQDAYNKCYF